MTHSPVPIAPGRYRESFGRYYEDFSVGDVYEHRPGRTISEADNTWFTLLTMTVNDVSAKAIANLGWKDIQLLAPVFAGDTLYAETRVLDKRESKSRPTQGVVTVMTSAFNQDQVKVMTFERTFLVAKRGHGVGE